MITKRTAQELRDDYLHRLDLALAGVPHAIAGEIRSGVAEELQGLESDAVAARIAQLGDPETIAREAQAASDNPAPAPATPERIPVTRTRGFAIIAALTLSFGGFAIPAFGWLIGAVLVSLSTLWHAWEKVVAIAVPLVAGTIAIALGLLYFTPLTATEVVVTSDGVGEPVNPLGPAWYDLIWLGIAGLGFLLIPLSGLWLLWRLRGRTAASDL